MATQVKSQQELYDLFIAALQDEAPDLTDDHEGSKIDSLAGILSFGATEINRLLLDKFNKTYFDTAHGPEVTGGDDDLQTLAVDHFGEDFARPGATKAGGTVTFSRPNTNAGDVTILAGTIVKTAPNANGVAQRYVTLADVTMTGLSINALVEALVAGPDGNVDADTVIEIETALTDSSVVVTNADGFSGGEAQEDDATYRETIRNKIEALKGATVSAIEADAKTVAGVATATLIETEIPVIEYDIATDAIKAGAAFFRIPVTTLYIADANGTASATLIAAVKESLNSIRAAGVKIDVKGATPVSLNWTASMTLNPAGPNFATLSASAELIEDSMREYISKLPIGTGFDKSDADDYILSIWGPSGTDDLTAFVTSVPAGDVAATASQKLIPGTIEVA